MEYNSEQVESLSQNDSTSSTASSARYHEDSISPEEQLLLQHHLQRGILETTEENIAFAKEISSVLSKLHVEPQSLCNDVKEGLQKVALILRYEKLSDLDDVALRIVCERKKIEEKKKQREEKQLELQYHKVFRQYATFSKKLDRLQEVVSSCEGFIEDAQKEQDIYCNRISMSTKLKEYQQAMEKMEADLIDMEIQDLHPQKILNKYKSYVEMSGELADLNRWLSQYSDLPPNLLQAKALLESKEKEYETLEMAFLEKTSYS